MRPGRFELPRIAATVFETVMSAVPSRARMVALLGLEPRRLATADFKSAMSTNVPSESRSGGSGENRTPYRCYGRGFQDRLTPLSSLPRTSKFLSVTRIVVRPAIDSFEIHNWFCHKTTSQSYASMHGR